MSYVYHRVPKNLYGSVLYPMNQLKNKDKETYSLYSSGYKGREHLLKRVIPHLDCLWNDAIHCCPVHPKKIFDALKKAGVKNIPTFNYYEIDINKDLDIKDAVIFFRNSDNFGDIQFEKAATADWVNVDVIPQLTLDYYNQVAKTNEPLFMYHGIPHFLYRGAIETKSLKILSNSQ